MLYLKHKPKRNQQNKHKCVMSTYGPMHQSIEESTTATLSQIRAPL